MPNPQSKPASPRPSGELPEVCLNLWYVCNGNGMAYRLAARAYALLGAEEEKLRVLLRLAGTDFYLAPTFEVPGRFKVVTDEGQISGMVPRAGMDGLYGEVFREVIDAVKTKSPFRGAWWMANLRSSNLESQRTRWWC